MSLTTSPDALSEANFPAFLCELPNLFPINSSACDSRNQFPALATKNPDNRGGYYTHQGADEEDLNQGRGKGHKEEEKHQMEGEDKGKGRGKDNLQTYSLEAKKTAMISVKI